MSYVYRRIFKSQLTGSAVIRELLQSMFLGEMLRAGKTAWIVSPWVSNVVLLDNRSGNFDTLNPEWGRREIRLSDVMLALLTRGRRVVIVTRDVDSNVKFLNDFHELADQHMLIEQVEVVVRDNLHTKGILFSESLLLGSMNLTFTGLEINDEWVEFSTDAEDLARTRLEFESYRKAES
jgi:phosphatidylserine/phosphatidylglycerophosphate/cardiolipin synthase-like enzyme